MITTIDITLLPVDVQELMLAKYRVALMDPDHRMTYEEAAWLYGYAYNTVRQLVCFGHLRTVGRWPNRRITHAAMRAYAARKRVSGAPRKALKDAQQSMA